MPLKWGVVEMLLNRSETPLVRAIYCSSLLKQERRNMGDQFCDLTWFKKLHRACWEKSHENWEWLRVPKWHRWNGKWFRGNVQRFPNYTVTIVKCHVNGCLTFACDDNKIFGKGRLWFIENDPILVIFLPALWRIMRRVQSQKQMRTGLLHLEVLGQINWRLERVLNRLFMQHWQKWTWRLCRSVFWHMEAAVCTWKCTTQSEQESLR